MLAVICTPFSDRRFPKRDDILPSVFVISRPLATILTNTGSDQNLSAGVIKGDLRMLFNPVAHRGSVGCLREYTI